MIPLSVPHLAGNEWTYLKDCLDTGWVSSVGSYVDRFEQAVANYTGAAYAVATSSGTAALHIALLLAGVRPNDLVLLPDITFVAPANAVRYLGADPLLIDVEAGSFQLDLSLLESFLDRETYLKEGVCYHVPTERPIRAVLPVHVLGNLTDMNRLLTIAQAHGIQVVEDASEALGSWLGGQHAGTFGRLGCLSFNGNKIITTGGGGMLLTNDADLARRAKHLTTQAKASADDYYHDEVGYNYRLVNVLAALGVAQMEQLPNFIQQKKTITRLYDAAFASQATLFRQTVAEDVAPNGWLYAVRVPAARELIATLRQQAIEARPLWVPMHTLPAFRSGPFVTERAVSNLLHQTVVCLPSSSGTPPDVIRYVADCVLAALTLRS